jgi:hypothetical protein
VADPTTPQEIEDAYFGGTLTLEDYVRLKSGGKAEPAPAPPVERAPLLPTPPQQSSKTPLKSIPPDLRSDRSKAIEKITKTLETAAQSPEQRAGAREEAERLVRKKFGEVTEPTTVKEAVAAAWRGPTPETYREEAPVRAEKGAAIASLIKKLEEVKTPENSEKVRELQRRLHFLRAPAGKVVERQEQEQWDALMRDLVPVLGDIGKPWSPGAGSRTAKAAGAAVEYLGRPTLASPTKPEAPAEVKTPGLELTPTVTPRKESHDPIVAMEGGLSKGMRLASTVGFNAFSETLGRVLEATPEEAFPVIDTPIGKMPAPNTVLTPAESVRVIKRTLSGESAPNPVISAEERHRTRRTGQVGRDFLMDYFQSVERNEGIASMAEQGLAARGVESDDPRYWAVFGAAILADIGFPAEVLTMGAPIKAVKGVARAAKMADLAPTGARAGAALKGMLSAFGVDVIDTLVPIRKALEEALASGVRPKLPPVIITCTGGLQSPDRERQLSSPLP